MAAGVTTAASKAPLSFGLPKKRKMQGPGTSLEEEKLSALPVEQSRILDMLCLRSAEPNGGLVSRSPSKRPGEEGKNGHRESSIARTSAAASPLAISTAIGQIHIGVDTHDNGQHESPQSFLQAFDVDGRGTGSTDVLQRYGVVSTSWPERQNPVASCQQQISASQEIRQQQLPFRISGRNRRIQFASVPSGFCDAVALEESEQFELPPKQKRRLAELCSTPISRYARAGLGHPEQEEEWKDEREGRARCRRGGITFTVKHREGKESAKNRTQAGAKSDDKHRPNIFQIFNDIFEAAHNESLPESSHLGTLSEDAAEELYVFAATNGCAQQLMELKGPTHRETGAVLDPAQAIQQLIRQDSQLAQSSEAASLKDTNDELHRAWLRVVDDAWSDAMRRAMELGKPLLQDRQREMPAFKTLGHSPSESSDAVVQSLGGTVSFSSFDGKPASKSPAGLGEPASKSLTSSGEPASKSSASSGEPASKSPAQPASKSPANSGEPASRSPAGSGEPASKSPAQPASKSPASSGEPASISPAGLGDPYTPASSTEPASNTPASSGEPASKSPAQPASKSPASTGEPVTPPSWSPTPKSKSREKLDQPATKSTPALVLSEFSSGSTARLGELPDRSSQEMRHDSGPLENQDLQPGTVVSVNEIDGLGCCERWDESTGYWTVHFQNGKRLRIKPKHLRIQAQEEPQVIPAEITGVQDDCSLQNIHEQAKEWKVGDEVQFFSKKYNRWIASGVTNVLRKQETGEVECYDLSHKTGLLPQEVFPLDERHASYAADGASYPLRHKQRQDVASGSIPSGRANFSNDKSGHASSSAAPKG